MTSSSRPTLLHAFSSFTLGGAQSRFIQLANAFGADFHHVIVAMDGQWQAADRLDAHVSWVPLKVSVVRGGGLANRASFRRVLREVRPDRVFSYNWGAIEWMVANCPRLAPHVHVEDGFGPDEARGQLPRRLWSRRVFFGVSGASLVVPSRRLREAADAWWLPAKRVRYIPNGVPVLNLAEPADLSPASRPLLIGTVAGLRPEKRLDRLVAAFARVRSQHDVHLVIVGDGPVRRALEAQAQALGVSAFVEFTGYLREPQVALRRFDLFALSSDTEQQPIAMLEAMMLGIPVISTAVGDVPHMLPPGCARLAAPDDEEFAIAMADALDRQGEWPRWAAAGRAQVESEYGHALMLSRWREVFNGTQPA